MDCDEMLALIHHYQSGGLSQWRQRALTRHLGDCPPCNDAHVYNQTFRQAVASKCSEEAPDALRMRINAVLGSLPPGDGPLDLSAGNDFLF